MIKSFKHAGLEDFYRSGSKRGINPEHASRLLHRLTALNVAKQPNDLSAPGWQLHQLHGHLAGHWSLTVSGNWRLTFRFEESDGVLVNYLDYH